MDRAVRDCLVTGYEPLIDSLALPDEGDRHVLAAAIAGRCDVIVTQNLRDFPAAAVATAAILAGDPGSLRSAIRPFAGLVSLRKYSKDKR